MNRPSLFVVIAVLLTIGYGCGERNSGDHSPSSAEGALEITETTIAFDPRTCKTGSGVLGIGLGSASIQIRGHDAGYCVFDYTLEIEGGYSTYRCRVPLSVERVTIEAVGPSEVRTSFDLAQCQRIKTGNVHFEDTEPPDAPDTKGRGTLGAGDP